MKRALCLLLLLAGCTVKPVPAPVMARSASESVAAASRAFNPGIVLVPSSPIVFTGAVNGPFPTPRPIRVSPTNYANWTSMDTSPWFDTSPYNRGGWGDSCILRPHTDGLAAGTYTENITFSAAGVPSKTISIKLVIVGPTPPPTPTPTATPMNSVRLAWNHGAPSGVTGYKVYWGPAPDTYTQTLDVGYVITAVVPNAPSPAFFRVAAYNALAMEALSTEVSN